MADPAGASLPTVSVVVPVFRNEATLVELHRRLVGSLEPVSDRLQVIYVDDAGPDSSWTVVRELAADDQRVVGLSLSHNVGALTAIATGCSVATGEITCSIDADLENRPEDLPALIDEVAAGHDLVSAVRVDRGQRPVPRRLGTLLTRVAIGGSWTFRPRDFGCGMKAWRTELGHTASLTLDRDRDVAWAVRLFSAARSYGEVETEWVDQGRRSSFTLSRKLGQAAMLLVVLHPGRVSLLRGIGILLLTSAASASIARAGGRRSPGSAVSCGVAVAGGAGVLLAGALQRAGRGIGLDTSPFTVVERCG